jgi:hypothetical protein
MRSHMLIADRIEVIARARASAAWSRTLRATHSTEEADKAERQEYLDTARELSEAHKLHDLSR